jgi:hypothetical protein
MKKVFSCFVTLFAVCMLWKDIVNHNGPICSMYRGLHDWITLPSSEEAAKIASEQQQESHRKAVLLMNQLGFTARQQTVFNEVVGLKQRAIAMSGEPAYFDEENIVRAIHESKASMPTGASPPSPAGTRAIASIPGDADRSAKAGTVVRSSGESESTIEKEIIDLEVRLATAELQDAANRRWNEDKERENAKLFADGKRESERLIAEGKTGQAFLLTGVASYANATTNGGSDFYGKRSTNSADEIRRQIAACRKRLVDIRNTGR